MRLWTLHPKYLDRRGLVALWREGLLAQAVLRGNTDGYGHHPQLIRFREQASPVGAIAEYLRIVHAESVARGYSFAGGKIGRAGHRGRIPIARGQLEFEWGHLMAKLQRRDPGWHARLERVNHPRAHPLFRMVPGPTESWEKGAAAAPPRDAAIGPRVTPAAGMRHARASRVTRGSRGPTPPIGDG
jgi:hypothetical protein